MFKKKLKKFTAGNAILLSFFALTSTAVALDNGMARKPPMGWNSYNVFKSEINEDLIKAIADKIVSTGLAEAGYEYVVLDNGWYIDPNANEVDTVKFPSGMKALADYLHERGLKLGLYTRWDSRGHETRDVNQWVEWGVDYMKHDAWKSYSTETEIWTDMRDAIVATDHPMVYSVHFQDRAAVIGDPGIVNMWRFTNDMVPYYNRDKLPHNRHWGMTTIDVINDMARVAPTTGPGCWADADMLMVGVGDQTLDEWKTQFAMWCLLPSPLMIPSDLRNTPREILDIFLNKEMIAINQDTLGSKTWRVKNDGDMQVWARRLGDGSVATVLLNSGPKDVGIGVAWRELKLESGRALVRNLWLHQDAGIFTDTYSTNVPSHGTAFLKITPETLLKGKADKTVADLYYDTEEKAIVFAAHHLKQILGEKGTTATLKPLGDLSATPEGTYFVVAKKNTDLQTQLRDAGGKALGTLGEQDYALRVTKRENSMGYWALGGDRIGAMYGGIHIGEIVAGGLLANFQDQDKTPYIHKRGLKFNIPLDIRTPSFDDGGASANTNRKNVWDINFWKEYFDVLARQRYNVLSLWNKHPFPSLVKVPGYEEIALSGVMDENYVVISNWSIERKIQFWNDVLELAYDRGIEVWPVVWNVQLEGTEGNNYGIDTKKGNPVTIDYIRKSVKQLFLTYPRLAGFGVTAGERMNQYSDSEKEQWVWDTYGQGVMDVKKLQPDRKIRFVHRHWLTDWDEIGSRFSQLPDGFQMALKYAQARLYSSTHPSWAARQLDKIPMDMETWWNLRNDDIFIQRWGDPDFVKEYILNFPHKSKPCDQSPCLTAGYVMGSDRYFWARESMSKNPQTPRQLESEKHWYKFLLWGRLGYDPYTSKDLLKGLIQYKFPTVDSSKVFDAWQAASKIIPTVNRFHWRPWDYMWWVEKGTSNSWSDINGYHNINHVIVNKTQNVSGYATIEEFVDGKETGISPLDVADSLEANASAALAGIAKMKDGGNIELRETLGDIRSQAYFGLYWAHKIRGGVELQRYRKTKNITHKENAIAHLEKALVQCKYYAAQLEASYEKVRFSGHDVFDWDALTPEVENDIKIAQDEK